LCKTARERERESTTVTEIAIFHLILNIRPENPKTFSAVHSFSLETAVISDFRPETAPASFGFGSLSVRRERSNLRRTPAYLKSLCGIGFEAGTPSFQSVLEGLGSGVRGWDVLGVVVNLRWMFWGIRRVVRGVDVGRRREEPVSAGGGRRV
jgi:hypothetical protein